MNNLKIGFFFFLFLFGRNLASSQGDKSLVTGINGDRIVSELVDNLLYFGQRPPGINPEIFAPLLISKPNRHEFGSVFSKKADEFYFAVDDNGKAEIWFSRLADGVWSEPVITISNELYSFNDPMLSLDEERLYFISNQPLLEDSGEDNYNIWFIERREEHWSDPVPLNFPVNSASNEYYISFSNNGNIYFSSDRDAGQVRMSNFDIFKAGMSGEEYLALEKLPETVNSGYFDADVFVAPDESYLIFSSVRPEGLGQGDLYISYKNEEGFWTEARNMGSLINDSGHQLCPFVSRDGEYLFFTSNQDIYWVDADIIEDFR